LIGVTEPMGFFLFFYSMGEKRERDGERWHTCTCKWWSKRRFIDVENVMRLMGVSGPECWAILERSQGGFFSSFDFWYGWEIGFFP